MADVCQMAPAVLSPISPNESRKRRHGHGYGPGGEDAAPSTWFKRHRTGASFARRLLHLRGFAVDVRRAEDIVRFLDQFPPELDKDVSRILEKCADVDDAEKQLTALRLTFSASGGERGGDAPAAGVEAVASAAAAARDDADARATATATAAEGGGAANASTSAALKAAGGAADAIGDPADGVVLSGEWVGALVNEMSASADVPDAHERGTRVLRAFETAVRNAVARAAEGGAGRARAPPREGSESAGNNAEEQAAERRRVADENVILKRGLNIQTQRVEQLTRACATLQEQMTQLQRNNYSLSVHLKEAMRSRGGAFDRQPDVF